MVKSEAVKVIVRCRPLNSKEKSQGFHNIVEIDEKNNSIHINNNEKQFTFDNVFNDASSNKKLYEKSFRNIVSSTIQGFNGTIFAYGQTGTGKTHTMAGTENDPGVIPMSFHQIFNTIDNSSNNNQNPHILEQYLVRASYLEIYMEQVKDLLSKDPNQRLHLHETPERGVYVKNLLSYPVKSVKEIQHVMNVGAKNRSVGRTDMNEHSSRSHAIFIVTIECSVTDTNDKSGKPNIRVGKLNMVDLAGSERQSKTGSTGERFKEATKINLSLANLANVISKLVKQSSHIPYRDSELTRLLQDSLGGNSKTIMVANIGPANYNYDETCNTLRYANRAKQIKNKPKINEDPKDAKLREYQEQIAKLRQQLLEKSGKVPRKIRSKKKKITKINPETGEQYSEYETDSENESNDSDHQNNEDPEEIAEMKKQLQEEKTRLENNHNLVKSERDRLLRAANEKIAKIKEREKDHQNLLSKIKKLESNLIIGGMPISQRTEEQELELERKKQLIAKHQQEEAKLKAEYYKEEEDNDFLTRKYTSIQEEVDIKSKKLKSLFRKMKGIQQDIDEVGMENAREMQEMQSTYDDLVRNLRRIVQYSFKFRISHISFISSQKYNTKNKILKLPH